jgi:hypothetical protein
LVQLLLLLLLLHLLLKERAAGFSSLHQCP